MDLNKTLDYILFRKEQLTIENRLLLNVIIFGIAACIIGSIISIIISSSFQVIIVSSILLLFFASGLLFSKDKTLF